LSLPPFYTLLVGYDNYHAPALLRTKAVVAIAIRKENKKGLNSSAIFYWIENESQSSSPNTEKSVQFHLGVLTTTYSGACLTKHELPRLVEFSPFIEEPKKHPEEI